MIRDRLEELTKSAEEGGVNNEAYTDTGSIKSFDDIERQEEQARLDAETSDFIAEHQLKKQTSEFLTSVSLIQDQVVHVLENIAVLKSYHQQALAAVDVEQDLADKIEDINGEVKIEARKIRSKLKSMKQEVNQTPKENKGSFDDRCMAGKVQQSDKLQNLMIIIFIRFPR